MQGWDARWVAPAPGAGLAVQVSFVTRNCRIVLIGLLIVLIAAPGALAATTGVTITATITDSMGASDVIEYQYLVVFDPEGNTEFQFQAGDLKFRSSSYDWLVVAGTKAKYRGTGTINGEGEYGFMPTATDGDSKDKADTFRMKIWDKETDAVIYDNQMTDADDADATFEIAGGSITVHKG